jgi:hypothetical protein
MTLFNSLDQRERVRVLSEAGGVHDPRTAPGSVLAPLLRRIDVTDEEFAILVQEAQIELAQGSLPHEVVIKFSYTTESRDTIAITDLTAASVTVWEIAVRVASVLRVLSVREELTPPGVSVAAGSVSFSLGGSTLLVSGVGFVVAAHSGLVAQSAAQLTYWSGAFLGSLGVIDLAVNWYKTIKDAAKADSDTQLNHLKARQTEREIREAESTASTPAALVPSFDLSLDARRFALDEALAIHLLNKTLPAVHQLISSSGTPIVSVSEGGKSQTKAASS